MGYLGEEIPKLGFGLMRLPMIGDEIDIDQVNQMVDLFLEKGFTYFDTAFGYHGGKSEEAVKTCLVERHPRESFQLATKLPAWAGAKNAEEAREMFYTSLRRTGAGYFDFYLLHNLGDSRTKVFEDYDLWTFVKDLKAQGLIKHLGFSMHDTAVNLEKVLQEHPEVEFVQLQLNYADWDDPAIQSRKCYEVARKYNKPVIVMEPIKGGNLSALPPEMTKLMKDYAPDASLSSWAIRYIASKEGLVTVLSGMSTLEQMQDNLSYMENFQPMNQEELDIIAAVVAELNKKPSVPCTACGYCTKGCPMNINIPGVFKAVNFKYVYENDFVAKREYGWATGPDNGNVKASTCIECGQCESVCPQHLGIIEELKKCVSYFE